VRFEHNLDFLKGEPVYLSEPSREFGYVDDVIVDPAFGVLAIVCHSGLHGTWAFPYTANTLGTGGIMVDQDSSQSPRIYLRRGRSYQDLIGMQAVQPDGAIVGRVKTVTLCDVRTGEIEYRISRRGLSEFCAPPLKVRASTGVVSHSGNRIVLLAEETRTPEQYREMKEAA